MSCPTVTTIQKTECIGNSLVTINSNFATLKDAACDNQTQINGLGNVLNSLLASLPALMNVRMSLSNSTPITTTDIRNATTLYIHPFNGTNVALWETLSNKWVLRRFDTVLPISLSGLLANTNYDIFLYYDSDSFQVDFIAWSDQTLGASPPTLQTQDGVLVRPGQPSKRLIGCLRTTNAGQTEVSFGRTAVLGGSHPKLFLWNYYNQQPASYSILDTGTWKGSWNAWTSTGAGATASSNGPFERFGGSSNNKVSFISRNSNIINLNSVHYVAAVGAVYPFYFTYSLNLETPTVAQIFARTPGCPIFETYSNNSMTQAYTNTVQGGYNYMQIVSMTYPGNTVNYLTWTNDRHSYGTIGTLAAL